MASWVSQKQNSESQIQWHTEQICPNAPGSSARIRPIATAVHFVHQWPFVQIEELRQFVSSASPHVLCFSETKLDKSILDGEISFENYAVIRKDRNRNGGGVACFIHKSLAFEVRTDFPNAFENIFIDILLPKTKPILLGVIYRPPSDMHFVDNLNSCISNSNSFNSREVILIGDFNVILIDRKKKLIREKG